MFCRQAKRGDEVRPLEGVLVIDFTQAYSGPYGTFNLADYGARVIKIERPGTGDQCRNWLPYNKDGNSGYFATINRNKESLTLDLRSEEGADVIKKLVAKADIVVDNFKTGTLDRLGLGYDVLKEINPKIIMASSNGYGQYGPNKDRAAYDNIIESTCGLMDFTGFPDGGPNRNGCSMADSYTGLMTSFAVMTAYYHMLKTGEGQRVDTAMQDALLAGMEGSFLEYSLNGKHLPRQGNTLGYMVAPYDVYECKDGWFSIATANDKGFHEMCDDMGMPELKDDSRFITNSLRCENIEALTEVIKPFFLERTRDELSDCFTGKYVGAAPVLNAVEAYKHPHMASRDMVVEVNDDYLGKYDTFGMPIRFEKTPGTIEKGAPRLGEHNNSILKELGYSDAEIKSLEDNEIIDTFDEAAQ